MHHIKRILLFFNLLNIFLIAVLLSCSPRTTDLTSNKPDEKTISNDSVNKAKEDKINVTDLKKEEESEVIYKGYNDSIFDEYIHTVLLYKSGWELSLPIIQLGTNETLHLCFDRFDNGIRRYKYKVEHCDFNWESSGLSDNQFIDGFNDEYFDQYELSVNTIQSYVHYSVTFPKPTSKITKSGNYIIKVYEEGDEKNVVVIKRFMVIETIVNIDAYVKDATDLMQKKYKQEIDFSINTLSNNFVNPSKNIKTVIIQNTRQDNKISNLKPRLIKGNLLDYDYDNENVFNGVNEFRNFDIKSLKFQSERIAAITFDNRANHVYLHPDIGRRFKVYKTEDDINGRFVIKKDISPKSNIEADYVFVHFTLQYEVPAIEGNIYVFGELTDWKLTEEGKMKYNYKKKAYETTLFLKQGYYNYWYVLFNEKDKKIDDTFVEGNHSETENDYFIFVYYYDIMHGYWRLVGFRQLNSIKDRIK